MDSFEINKIIASILLTALIIIGIGKIVDILFYVEKPKISAYKVEGIDQQVVGEVAAKIRAWRSPEPYKGKGIRYKGEYIFAKEGKKK